MAHLKTFKKGRTFKSFKGSGSIPCADIKKIHSTYQHVELRRGLVADCRAYPRTDWTANVTENEKNKTKLFYFKGVKDLYTPAVGVVAQVVTVIAF